jgi:hypothetical protein
MRIVRLVCILVLLSSTAVAARAQSYFGMAGLQCGQYTKAARSKDALYQQASQWLLGYVSGMNAAMRVAKGMTPLASLTNDQVLKSASDYCEANPAGNLANAANEWYASLPKQVDPQAEVKSEPAAKSGSLILNLDRTSDRKPLLDRH